MHLQRFRFTRLRMHALHPETTTTCARAPLRRLRDQQIQELKAEMATKDLRLSAARAELLESHMQLQVPLPSARYPLHSGPSVFTRCRARQCTRAASKPVTLPVQCSAVVSCEMQAREIELHEAYAKLTAGAMERGKLRSQLINTEVSRISAMKLAPALLACRMHVLTAVPLTSPSCPRSRVALPHHPRICWCCPRHLLIVAGC